MNINNKPSQIQSLEKTLQKVKSGKGKFVRHELVTKWLRSRGLDKELSPPTGKYLGSNANINN